MRDRRPFTLAETYATRRELRFAGVQYAVNARFPASELDVSERRQRQLWEAGYLRLPLTGEELVEGVSAVGLPGTPDRVVDPAPAVSPSPVVTPVPADPDDPILQDGLGPVDPPAKTRVKIDRHGKGKFTVHHGDEKVHLKGRDQLTDYLRANNLEDEEDGDEES